MFDFFDLNKAEEMKESLSKIKEHKLLKYWEGLGYYRRARNLLATSKVLVSEYNSKLPKTIKEIKRIKVT